MVRIWEDVAFPLVLTLRIATLLLAIVLRICNGKVMCLVEVA